MRARVCMFVCVCVCVLYAGARVLRVDIQFEHRIQLKSGSLLTSHYREKLVHNIFERSLTIYIIFPQS